MNMSRKMLSLFLAVSLITGLGLFLPDTAEAVYEELPSGYYFSLVDEDNNTISQTGTQVYVGDEYISSDNGRYQVVEVSGHTARCVYVGQEQMPEVNFDDNRQAWVIDSQEIPVVAAKPTIAIYHTHSDESYVPTDGKESKEGNGGIYDVGYALAQRLQQLGYTVEYNKNNHNPHDVNAYNRSRRTAASLLKNGSQVLIDVHRDAVPPNQYQTTVNGQEATKIKLVVGKTNPNSKTNLEFAKQLKAVMDKTKPGLSNGIFMGKGDYNQDLTPRSMLIEVGSHTNPKDDATKGVTAFADVLSATLGGGGAGSSGGAAAKPLQQNSPSAWTTILILLTVAVAAGAGFYLLNKSNAGR
ncbi:MAG TPA: stage II sporulation protein P [Syntrophomonas sp.]|jgi:stage II sporulation protein P|nr:stage II sporulation protein P [Syntrophomonas sp.]